MFRLPAGLRTPTRSIIDVILVIIARCLSAAFGGKRSTGHIFQLDDESTRSYDYVSDCRCGEKNRLRSAPKGSPSSRLQTRMTKHFQALASQSQGAYQVERLSNGVGKTSFMRTEHQYPICCMRISTFPVSVKIGEGKLSRTS